MKKLLPLFYFLLMLGCEDKEEELGFTVYSLPTEFPLDKEYSWEYETTKYNSKTEWNYELNPDTTYLDTLHVIPTEAIYSFYWWGNNPIIFNLAINNGDNFLNLGYKELETDTIIFFDKPYLWASYSKIFDTSLLSNDYFSEYTNRTTSIDTVNDTINNSYIFSFDYSDNYWDRYQETKIDLFGIESWNYFYDWENVEYDDVYLRVKKVRKLNLSSGRLKSKVFDEFHSFKTTFKMENNKLPYHNSFEENISRYKSR